MSDRIFAAGSILLATAAMAHGAEARAFMDALAAPVPVMAGKEPIQVAGNAAPFFGDIDEDGQNDLLVGQYQLGRLRVYRNLGTNARPRFDEFQWFRADRQIAAVPSGCNIGFVPHLVDYDGDRRTDLLTGAWRGELFLFRRRADGSFADAEVLQDFEGDVILRRRFPSGARSRYNSTVFAHDWDGDGDKDLVLGRTSYCLLINEGTDQQPIYREAQPIMVGDEPIRNGRISPSLADWDMDGRVDLITGRDRDIVWYRNQGADRNGAPILAPAERLLPDNEASRGGPEPPPVSPAHYSAICVADFNGDGRPDLLLGDEYRQSLREEARADLHNDRSKLITTAKKAVFREYQELRKTPRHETHEERVERYRNLVAKWQEYTSLAAADARQKFTGRVWFYERLAP